jgi:hypothetical protein
MGERPRLQGEPAPLRVGEAQAFPPEHLSQSSILFSLESDQGFLLAFESRQSATLQSREQRPAKASTSRVP